MVMAAAGAAASFAGDLLGFMKPTKAKLVCKDDNLPDGYQPIEVMFNPTEYTLKQSVNVTRNESPAEPGGTPQFQGTSAMTLSMTLFLDDFASLEGDVTPKISTLLGWTHPTTASIDADPNKPLPPMVGFEWGNPQLEGFFGFLTEVGITYTVFRMDGTPVQAKVAITIVGQSEKMGPTNPSSHAINSKRVRTLTDGDTLQSIAFRELGRPAYWRAIAELNGIDDPQAVRAGMAVLIPAKADAARDR
jgi:hypothetical protein